MCANQLTHPRLYGCCPTTGCTEVTADCTAYLVDPMAVGLGPRPNPHSLRPGHVPEAGGSQGGAPEDSGVWVDMANPQAPAPAGQPEGTWVPAGWPIGDTQILLVAPPEEEQQGGGKGVATSAPFARGAVSTAVAEGDCDGGLLVRVVPEGGGEKEEEVRLVPAAEGSAGGGSSVGEVWVAGSCLSGGYLGDPRVGGARFVRVELSQRQAERCVVHGGSGQGGRRGEAGTSWRQGQALGLGQEGQQQGEDGGKGEGQRQGQERGRPVRREVRLGAVYFRTGDLGRFDAGQGKAGG